MLADLHLHTIESDGTWTPKQLVQQALQHSLTTIAITDHDTTKGIMEAHENAPPYLEVIPGIELSSISSSGEEVHILGLWIDPETTPLQEQIAILRDSRVQRTKRILELLRDLGINLQYNEVLKYAKSEVVSRSHIASALVAKEVVTSKQEAFSSLIGQGAPAYVERHKLCPEAAVKLILQAKGVPILAHPGLLHKLEVLPSLVDAGLIGLEVIHSSHTLVQEAQFFELANTWGLLPAGGSDCHGPGGKDEVFLGRFTIPQKWVLELAQHRLT